jgi:hypothetical protein
MAGFNELTRRLMADRGISVRGLAKLVHYDQGGMSKILRGLQPCPPYLAQAIDDALEARGAIIAAAREASSVPRAARKVRGVMAAADDEIAALELARRAEASDVGDSTCEQLELAVDDLATAYPRTPPGDLIVRVREHLGYTSRLLDGRATLAQHRRLLVSGGWLSLLAATCLIDLHQGPPVLAYLRTAEQLARETGHAEITAWCAETRAWQMLTSGGYRQAVELSRAAQEVAPNGGSARIQATAQEGRAWARLGDSRQTRAALTAVERLVSPLPPPERPEHHYVYDPPKARVYVATTLAWLGDTAAEPAARDILATLENPGAEPPRPRRIALARLDLALALTAAGKLDEATASAADAVTSGRLAPVDRPRVREIVAAVTDRDVPEARQLAEAYRSEFSGG